MNKNKLEKIGIVILTIVILIVMFIGINENSKNENVVNEIENNKIYYEIDNIPKFSLEDLNIEEDYYSSLENEKVRNGND